MDDFENHCWKDIVPAAPTLLAIELYELSYQGGPRSVAEFHRTYPSSRGENAYAAIEPTKRLFAAARAASLQIFYATQDTHPDSLPNRINSTKRQRSSRNPTDCLIKAEFKPQVSDIVGTKQRASAFYDTPLLAPLTQLGVQTMILCGESTSGCVRASAVDAYFNGFHVAVAEECCFDRGVLSHKVNLFDLHHKYTDVMPIEGVVAHLDGLAVKKAS